MGYTKAWVPPTIPLCNNLSAWKTLFNDLHDNLILSGLAQTDTAGQLVINDVETLPADNAFAGFIEYAFTDDLQATAPIKLQLYYGCGVEGLYSSSTSTRSRTPRIKCEVYFKSALVSTFQCPQAFHYANSSVTTQLTDVGYSLLCNNPDLGFFGITYGAGSRNKPFANSYGSYYGATFTCCIQRYLDNNGTPIANGIAILSPNLGSNDANNIWASGNLNASYNKSCSFNISASRTDLMPRLRRATDLGSITGTLVEPVYYIGIDNQPKLWPNLVTYLNSDITACEEFSFTPAIGAERNFVALGNETCLSVAPYEYQRAAFAMLFE